MTCLPCHKKNCYVGRERLTFGMFSKGIMKGLREGLIFLVEKKFAPGLVAAWDSVDIIPPYIAKKKLTAN